MKRYISAGLSLAMVLGFLFPAHNTFAAGAPTLSSATLNTLSSVTVAPSASISAAVTGVAHDSSSGAKWRSVKWGISSSASVSTCANTTDISNTSSTVSFTITAPASVGTYKANFQGFTNDTCTTDPSVVLTLNNAVVVAIPDTTAPVIDSHSDVTAEATSSSGATVTYTAPNATDNVDATALATCVPSSGTVFSLGTTQVTCTKTDTAGNAATATNFSIIVGDTTAPVITLDGSNPQTILVDNSYSELGATITDNYDTALSATIDSSAVDTNTPGDYSVTYNVTDSHSNIAIAQTRIVKVRDQEAPVITIEGANPQIIEVHTPYAELGATVTDNHDSGLSAIIDSSAVNVDVLGSYSVTYNASDSSENSASQATRTVTVVDTTAPVITMIGSETINLILGDSYEDAGATASDNHDGNITESIVKGGSFAGTGSVGTFTITYDVTDNEGNSAMQVIRTINVSEVPDTTAPIITLAGNSPVTLTVGDSYIDAGATATDDVDGNITESIVTVNPVNTAVAGTYIVSYNVHDAAGNNAVEVTRTVNVNSARRNNSSFRLAPTSGTGGQVLGAEKFIFTLDLKLGSKGDEVTELQKFLNGAGYDCGAVDGKFGPKTKACVMAFQKANPPLKVDGIVGPLTREVLNK